MSNDTQRYTKHNFRKSVLHFFMGKAVQGLAFFTLTLILVRVMAPSDYGAYMALLGMIEVLVPLSSFGMLEVVRRYLPELASRGTRSGLRRFIACMLLFRLGVLWSCGAVLLYLWGSLSSWLGYSLVQQDVKFIAILLMVQQLMFRFLAEILESLMEQRSSQLARALLPLGQLVGVGIILSVWKEPSLQRILVVDLAATSTCLLLAAYYVYQQMSISKDQGSYDAGLVEVSKFAWHIAGANLLQSAANFGALRMIVANRLGLEAAGIFAFLQQIMLIVGRYLPANLLANLIRPMLISRYTSDKNAKLLSDGISLMWKSNLILVGAAVIAFFSAGDEIIDILSGGRASAAGVIMAIMFLALAGATQRQLLEMSMQITGHTYELRTLSLMAPLMAVFVWFGAEWGLLGVALGMLMFTWSWNSITVSWMRVWGKDSVQLDWIGGAGIAIICCALVLSGVFAGDIVNSWVMLVVVQIIYIAGLFLLRPIIRNEMNLIEGILGKKANLLAPFVSPTR